MAGIPKKKRQTTTNVLSKNHMAVDRPVSWVSIFFWWLLVFFTAITLWIGNGYYLSHLFERDRHFSHLSDFEREMSYRTEMGLYFSYYKTIINAPSFTDGVYKIMNDNITEYGHTINTLQRFNLYPELLLSAAYRIFKGLVQEKDWKKYEICWRVNRGNLPPIDSCEGIGNSHFFYVYNVFGIAGSVLASVFLLGVILSGSYFGGLISASAFLFNHGEATRVQWTPPLRESFAYPVFLAQICLLSYILKTKSCKLIPFISFTFLTVSSLLFWQFSQFALTTQLGSLFLVYTLELTYESTMKSLLKSYMISFLISYSLLFGNTMLLSSLFFSSIVSIFVIMQLRVFVLSRITFRPIFILAHLLFFVLGVFGIKSLIGRLLDIRDDDHIFDILRSKFTDFANFHTRLYTCAVEFDFISTETLSKLSYTLLLPTSALALLLVVAYLLRYELNLCSTFFWRENTTTPKPKPYAEIIYNVAQLVIFCIMAILIMRLKLFATPHLCIISALIVNGDLLSLVLSRKVSSFWRSAFAIAVISGMGYQGVKNIQQQLSIAGEYSNPEQEALFNWIQVNTRPEDVFAGSMPVMANLKLSTERPIVNHPHYENEEIRNRTMKVYSLYSRKPIHEVYQTLKSMRVDYYVFQPHNCQPNPRICD